MVNFYFTLRLNIDDVKSLIGVLVTTKGLGLKLIQHRIRLYL
jgi:hypothetical protein